MAIPTTGAFVFTDLVDSTAIASRLGPDAAEELRQAHFGVLRSAASSTGGIEVKSTGDGLMLMFTSPSRAVSCAVAIQQGIDRHNLRASERLAVRIGIAMGEATEEAGDYYGDCVVEAARLCAAAQGGQILATQVVQLMVGRHAQHDFVEVGELELKGLPDAVPTVEVLWEPAVVEGAVPLPSRLVGAATEGLFGFFGRSDELAALDAAAKRAVAESRVEVILLAGEPGIGKTTLAAQVARSLHANGAAVLFGHCAEGVAAAYQPWIEAVSHLVEHAPLELLQEHVQSFGGTLARIVPRLATRTGTAVPEGTGEGDQFLLLEDLVRIVESASDSLIVVVLDDLQWADVASLQVLRHALVRASFPLLVIGTYRDSDLSRDHPLAQLLADLHREPTVTRVPLRGLDDRDIFELMQAAAGHELPPEGVALAHALYREADGNPFFTGELLRHLYEIGAIAFDESGQYELTIDLDEVGLPGSVRDVVTRRVDRLGDDRAKLLTLASVIGREFDVEVLAELAERDVDSVIDDLEVAATAALVTEQGGALGVFRFEHALIQHTLYQDLSALRRQRLHQRVAEVLEARSGAHAPPVAELAHHWLAATQPTDVGKALNYARLAGEAAMAALAPDDAVRWYSQALELQERLAQDDVATRCDLLVGLGDAQRTAGMPQHRETLLQAFGIAERQDDPARMAAAAIAMTRPGSAMRDTDDELTDVLERALDAVGPADSRERALLLAARGARGDQSGLYRTELIVEAVAIARRLDDPPTLLRTVTIAAASPRVATWHEDLELAREAVELADREGDPRFQFLTQSHLTTAALGAGDADAYRRGVEALEALAVRHPLPYMRWTARLFATARLLNDGRADEAEVALNEALEIALQAGEPEAFAAYGGVLVSVRRHQGRLGEIREMLVAAAADNPGLPVLASIVPVLHIECGEPELARTALEQHVTVRFSDMPDDLTWPSIVQNHAHVAVALEHEEAAELLYEMLSPYEDLVSTPNVGLNGGAIARVLGTLATVLGRYEEAERLFVKGYEINARFGDSYWTARTLLEHAELCVARSAPDDPQRARELAERGLAVARAAGCEGLVAHGEDLLRSLAA